MKTIKDLEKEIENLKMTDKVGYKPLIVKAENQLQTLKEVLKLIDDWWVEFCDEVLNDGQDEEKMFKELKQKLTGEER